MEIIYIKVQNIIEVKEGKKTERLRVSHDLNAQCRNLFIYYFINAIAKLCKERLNALKYADFVGVSEKYLFFEKTASSATEALRQDTWRNYLHQTLKKMRENAPSTQSRYYKNYIIKLNEMEEAFQKYVKPDKYYKESGDGLQLNLFNN